jgi:ubiquinone/menaquinone biosynthesis C-methylase UbiE
MMHDGGPDAGERGVAGIEANRLIDRTENATPSDEFLIVDEFLRTLADARALKTALEVGLIDRLLEHRSGSAEALGRALRIDAKGLRLLLDLLSVNNVVEEQAGDLRLTKRFRSALRYRDLLEAKLDFAGFSIGDFADRFTALVQNARGFMGEAQLFQLFDYRRCFDTSIDNYLRARVWMRITSALTRYEAGVCARLHDFARYRRMLDVGGNSGEFALQLCRRHPTLRATVLDLPLVCEIGMEHVLAEPEHDRIAFMKADLRSDQLPPGHDLITFKSMLHDWPQQEARQFIDKAARSLEPGGTLLIFERAPMRFRDASPPLSLLPSLLFFRFYRPASDYVVELQAQNFQEIAVHEVELDTPFFVVTGRKPLGGS